MKSRKDFESEQEYKAYLRTHFAMAAMQGLLSSCDATVQHMEPNAQTIEYLVELSVTAADSLLKHLES
jgi:hypothetical protein